MENEIKKPMPIAFYEVEIFNLQFQNESLQSENDKLKEENKMLQDANYHLGSVVLPRLVEEKTILREALEFYADYKGENWGTNDPNGTSETCQHILWETSGGMKAREALAKVKK